MSLEPYRRLFIVGVCVIMILATVPIMVQFIHLPSSSQRFSELWIFDSEHSTRSYPFNVSVTESYSVYVVVSNHLGYSAYCRVYLKFRNSTESLPNMVAGTPSTLPSYYEFDLFVKDGSSWETLMNFSILETESANQSLTVRKLLINDVPLDVDVSSTWIDKRGGYYYFLFFELWQYDLESRDFAYQNRYVGIWLNVNASRFI